MKKLIANVEIMSSLLVTNPENAQFIQPPIIIMGRTLVMLPFSMSFITVGSVIGLFAGAGRRCVLKNPVSSLLKKWRLMRKDCFGRYFPFSLNSLARTKT